MICNWFELDVNFRMISSKPRENKEVFIPTEKHMKTIIAFIKGTNIEIPVLLARLHGLRQSEIASCEWVKLKDNVLQIRGAVVPDENHKLVSKNTNKSISETRDIILVDYVLERFEELKGTGKMSNIRPSSVLRSLKKMCIENGLPPYTMHSLRHYHASVMKN